MKTYKIIEPIGYGLYTALKDGKSGVVTDNGGMILPFEYDSIGGFDGELFTVCKDDKWGYVNNKNELIIDFKFAFAFTFSEGLAPACLDFWDTGMGYIDKKGDFVIKPAYKDAGLFDNGIAVVSVAHKTPEGVVIRYGVINKTGEFIIQPLYKQIKIKDDYIICHRGFLKKKRYFDFSGNKM